MEWRRIRPAASHYLLHSAAQPSHLNCIQPTGFPQHTAHNVPFYVSFSKLSPPRIGVNGEKVALENTMPLFFYLQLKSFKASCLRNFGGDFCIGLG